MPELTLYFHPGDYPIFDASNLGSAEHQLRISGDIYRVVKLIGIPDSNGKLPRLILRPQPTNSFFVTQYAAKWPPSFFQQTLIATAADNLPNNRAVYRDPAGAYRDYLGRIEIENLELDGAFSSHTPFSTPANPSGYKSSAIEVWARTGRIKNVKVRNFGSVGSVPYSLVEGNSSGVESFPVSFTTFDDTKPATPDPTPWFLEDVEVSDFQSVHGGYGTMILGSVNTTTADTSSRSPLALIRRCVVNGGLGTIAFGAAGHTYYVLNNPANWSDPAAYTKTPHYSSLSRHEANIILNAGAAYNTDTGAVHDFRLNNGVYLDLLNLGYLGVAEVGSGGAWHVNYELNTNLIRLRGRQAISTYSEFYITNNSTWGTDPNLALGRPITNLSVGITIQGVANTLKLIGNRFTTWPAAGFLMSNPLSTNESLFRLMWPIESYTWYSSQHYSRLRNPAENVTLSANSFSTNAFEFLGVTALTDHSGIPSFTSNSAPSYTGLRLALTTPPPGFTPAGKVERVESTWSGTNLTAVKEVAFGQTFITNGNQIAVTLRAVEHKTSASGSSGTVAITNKTVWLAADISPTNGGTNALAMVSATTSSSGIATFNLSLGTHASAWIRLKGWLPPVSGATNLDQTQRAWASHDLNFGTVVQLSAMPDVADDKNTSAGKRAVLRFTRTGSSASLSNTLVVSFALPASGVPELISPVDYRNLIASYGTTGSADYYFGTPVGGSLSSISQGGANTVTFSANSAVVEVPIITRVDNLTEANTIRVALVASPNYAIGASSRADVLIYDGPLWDFVELSPSDQQQTTLSVAYGLNSGVTDSSGAFTVNPRIVGRYSYYGTPDVNAGGVWKWPQTTLSPLGATFFPQSVSFRSLSSDFAWIAGYDGNLAKVVRENGTSWTTLGHLYSGPSAALAISPDSSFVAGFSGESNGPPRAVYWNWLGSSTPVNVTASSVVTGDGKAYAVNDSGVIAGYMTATFNGTTYSSRPFRTPNTMAVDDVGDLLPPPSSGFTSSTGSGAANAVSSSSIAVGWINRSSAQTQVAVVWDSRTGSGSNPSGESLGTWFPSWQEPTSNNTDLLSEALSVNDADANGGFQIVGWSSSTTNATVSRAVFKSSRYSSWIDLNDRHYANYPSGWNLRRAKGVNKQRLIIGSAVNPSGAIRDFVLVPRNNGQ